MTQPDMTLLQHWRAHRDAEAFNEIVTRYVDLVYGTCKRVLGNETDAQDVTQECFIRLAAEPGQVRSSLGGWLHRLATHRSRDFLKAESRRRRREERFAEAVPQSVMAEWGDIQGLVDEAIEQLPEKQRRVIVAHFLQRKTHEAIARELGVTRPAVSHQIRRGVDELRKHLQDRGVTVTAGALLAMLPAGMGEAAPVHLAAAIGKLALAGTGRAVPAGGGLLGGTLSAKHVAFGLAGVVLGALALWATGLGGESPAVPSAAKMPAVSQEQGAVRTPQAVSTEPEVEPAETVTPNAGAAAHAVTSMSEDVLEHNAATKPAGGMVEGVVVDGNGVPIGNASVFLQTRPEQENPFRNAPVARTAADGTFRVEGVGVNLSAIFADHGDFSPGWTSIAPDPDRPETVRITLLEGGAIAGTVTVGGVPCQGNVAAMLHCVVDSEDSGSDGQYRLERITPGIVEVIAFVTRHRSMSTTAIVEPGKTTIVDFAFPAANAILEGHVIREGAPVPKAILRLSVSTAAEAYETYCTAADAEGRYRFENLPPGKASMAAYSTGKGESRRRASVSFAIAPEGITIQDVDLAGGDCAVSGQVDVPRAGCGGAICLLSGTVELRSFTMSALQNLDSLMVALSDEMTGSYRFDGLVPGTYTLVAVVYPDKVDTTSDSMGEALVAMEVVRLDGAREEIVDLWPLPVLH